ncbi:DNA-binding transcriptional regulator, LysR family [Allopseudospirillum japonicum]|uniref:DNA-binding transcriptional regulator, LysR family n=1 Tax=Allopseudospirillum japonicum TaxID=64971 RepID=A0A1H6SBQ3_9GAMM|nr:LysR substrate-binding domain-containing protein [Allopseudospirillum japonicum]SEI63344.1 DNA-binding transcriptional regulator, LysR family [Allopseudospirillum japonicum]
MAQWEGVNEFVAVVESGSFTQAAQRIGISTAQVSRLIAQLEQRLATKLLYRSTRKVSVTEAGTLYYQHCRQVLDALEAAERKLTYLQTTPRGKLRITMPITYGEKVVAPLLNDFMCDYPELKIQVQLSNQKLDLVKEGFDLAVRIGKLEDSNMMAKRLATRRLFLCASPSYIQTYGMPQALSELNRHNCLLGTLDFWRFKKDGKEYNLRVQGSLRYNSGHALVDAALKGLGLVQLPDFYVQSSLHCKDLIEVLPEFQPEDEDIWALYPHDLHLSPKVRRLVDFLKEKL